VDAAAAVSNAPAPFFPDNNSFHPFKVASTDAVSSSAVFIIVNSNQYYTVITYAHIALFFFNQCEIRVLFVAGFEPA
jgi:hypothetical protein